MFWLQEWWADATAHNLWLLALGWAGQGLFSVRFLVQWIASERAGRSVVPQIFWYVSIAAASLVLIYGIIDRDLVVISGQLPSLFIYLRNAQLNRRQQAAGAT